MSHLENFFYDINFIIYELLLIIKILSRYFCVKNLNDSNRIERTVNSSKAKRILNILKLHLKSYFIFLSFP